MKKERDAFIWSLIFLALIMWALSFPSIKVTLREVGPLTLAALRFVIAIPIIYAFYLVETAKRRKKIGNLREQGRKAGEKKRRGDQRYMLYGFAIFNVILPNIFQNYGMQSTGSGVTSIIQGSGPVFTIFLAALFLKERLTRFRISGMVLAFVGSVLLVTGGEMNLSGSTMGKFLILLSAISYSISGVIAKKLLMSLDSAEITFFSFLYGGLVLFLAAVLIERPLYLMELGAFYWGNIMFIALLPTGLAYIFWYRAMKDIPLSKIVISVFLIPVMAVIFSYLLLGEEIGLFTLGTGAMVIAGVLIAEYDSRRDRQNKK